MDTFMKEYNAPHMYSSFFVQKHAYHDHGTKDTSQRVIYLGNHKDVPVAAQGVDCWALSGEHRNDDLSLFPCKISTDKKVSTEAL